MEARVALKDHDTGEERLLASGPMVTAGGVIDDAYRPPPAQRKPKWALRFIAGFDEVGSEELSALSTITFRSDTWRQHDGTEALERYLHVAVREEAKRLRLHGVSKKTLPLTDRLADPESDNPEAQLVQLDPLGGLRIVSSVQLVDRRERERNMQLLGEEVERAPADIKHALGLFIDGHAPTIAEALRQAGDVPRPRYESWKDSVERRVKKLQNPPARHAKAR